MKFRYRRQWLQFCINNISGCVCVSLEQSLLGNTVKEILLPFFMLKIQDICSDVYCNESVVMLTLNRCRNKHCACCPGSRSSYTPESSGLSLSKECSCCINKGPFLLSKHSPCVTSTKWWLKISSISFCGMAPLLWVSWTFHLPPRCPQDNTWSRTFFLSSHTP